MSKKIFTVGDLPVFIEAENVDEAIWLLRESLETIKDCGDESVFEIESEITETAEVELTSPRVDKSKLN